MCAHGQHAYRCVTEANRQNRRARVIQIVRLKFTKTLIPPKRISTSRTPEKPGSFHLGEFRDFTAHGLVILRHRNRKGVSVIQRFQLSD